MCEHSQPFSQEDYPLQITSLRIKSYRSWRIDDNASDEAQTRLKQLERMAKLREEGCSEATALSVGGGSRATCYRWLKRYRQSGVKGLENGGREFRDECEPACRALGIALYALPPRQPKYNGWVERANGTSRYECYPCSQGALTVGASNPQLAACQTDDNPYRPHDGIGLLSPREYYQQRTQTAPESHAC